MQLALVTFRHYFADENPLGNKSLDCFFDLSVKCHQTRMTAMTVSISSIPIIRPAKKLSFILVLSHVHQLSQTGKRDRPAVRTAHLHLLTTRPLLRH